MIPRRILKIRYLYLHHTHFPKHKQIRRQTLTILPILLLLTLIPLVLQLGRHIEFRKLILPSLLLLKQLKIVHLINLRDRCFLTERIAQACIGLAIGNGLSLLQKRFPIFNGQRFGQWEGLHQDLSGLVETNRTLFCTWAHIS